MLGPFAHRVACCCVLSRVVVRCWIRLHSSSNFVGATHAHYTWSAWSLPSLIGMYPSHDALQVPTLFGVVASVCTPLLKQTQQFPSVASVFTGLDLYRSPLFKCVCGGRGGLCRAGRREPWERGCLFLIISYDA